MPDKIVSPLYDYVFAQVFGNKRNLDNTKAFLKTLLDIPESDYDRLTVENPILQRLFRRDKMGIVDLKLSTKSGKIIHIELQVNKESNLRSRILYYAARLLGDQMQWGEDYKELHQVISIIICNHILLDEDESYINVYELRNERNRRFTNLLKVVILELPKLPEEEDSRLWPWLRFFKCKRREEYEMLAKKHPELKKAVSCVKKISFGERWRYTLLYYQMQRMDARVHKKQIQEDIAEGRAKGRAEGHAEGRAEGLAEGLAESRAEKLEIARKMKARGRPLEEIVEDSGLSLELIETL